MKSSQNIGAFTDVDFVVSLEKRGVDFMVQAVKIRMEVFDAIESMLFERHKRAY